MENVRPVFQFPTSLNDRKLNLIRTFSQLLIVFIKSRHLQAISALRQSLIQSERSAVDAFVDIRRRDARTLGEDAELVVSRVRVRLPFHFPTLRAHFSCRLWIDDFQIALEEMDRVNKKSLVRHHII